MSSDSSQIPPPPPPPDSVPPQPTRTRTIGIAAGFGVGVLLAGMIPLTRGQVVYSWLLFDVLLAPLIAIVLAVIPRTRPFGLGLLMACGLGWMVLLCICGGVFRR